MMVGFCLVLLLVFLFFGVGGARDSYAIRVPVF